ncbi:MAG TPA: hypothetical protein VFV86_04190, partial [Nitrososphaeraceae archaeon]|nr:hypothetical protein [Nitrososphaeraceae archaeon]
MEDTYNLRSVNKLKGLIETKYGIKITKKGNSFIVFPSETLVHIRGSKILHDKVGEYGFYHFLKNNFENLLNSNKSFFAVVYDNPEITFLIPKDSLASIFKNDLITNESESPRWYFYIRKSIDNKYFIDFRKENVRPIDITDYLNKWNQIDDIGQIDKREVQYFLVQVNRPGSENIINFNKYEHYNWQDTPRDIYHGQVKEGDKLLVYFASNSINYKKQLKKIYRVKQVSEKNEYFDLIEEMELNGLTLNDIKNGTQNGKLRKEVFDKLSQRGFNIIKIDKSDYDSVISLDKESIKQVAVFLTGYSNGNVQT